MSFEFPERDADVLLEGDELLLLFLDGGGVAAQEHDAVGLGGRRRSRIDPGEVGFVAGKTLMKWGEGILTLSTQICWILRSKPRTISTMSRTESHRRSMDREVKRIFSSSRKSVAAASDRSCLEALLTRALCILPCSRRVLKRSRASALSWQRGRDGSPAIAFFVAFFLFPRARLLRPSRGRLFFDGIGVDETVDQFVDAHLFGFHPGRHVEDFGNGGGAGGNRLDHA